MVQTSQELSPSHAYNHLTSVSPSNLLKLQLPRRIRHTSNPYIKIRISPLLPTDIPDIPGQDCPGDNHLDLIGGEEASGAGMSTIPESQAVLTDADELIMRRSLYTRRGGVVEGLVGFAHTVEAEAVEVIRVGEGGWVAGDAVGGDFDGYAGWEDSAVREVDWLEDFALEGGWEG